MTKKKVIQSKNNHNKIKITFVCILIMTLFCASTITLNSFLFFKDHKIATTEASTLAEVGLLENVNVNAVLSNLEGTDPYHLNLVLTGNGVADVELTNNEKTAAFYLPDLAGDLFTNDSASVSVELLPITIPENSGLGVAIGGLTGTLTELVEFLVNGIDAVVNGTLLEGIIRIDGLEAISDSLNNLNNLSASLEHLTAYQDDIDIIIDEQGYVAIEFEEGLGQHLDSVVSEVVINTVTDLLTAIDNLDISLLSILPGVGGLLDLLVIDPILNPLLGAVTSAVNTILEGLASGTIDIAQDLANLQVLGNTRIELDLNVSKDTTATGMVPVRGTVFNLSNTLIDVSLFDSLEGSDVIRLPEPPSINPIDDIEVIENQSIDDIQVVVEQAGEYISIEENGIKVENLPPGLTYNSDTNAISGIPTISDWEPEELYRDFVVVISATNTQGMASTKEFTIKVRREPVLRFDYVPENISFGEVEIQSGRTKIYPTDPDLYLSIFDTRTPGSSFNIKAQVIESATEESDRLLPRDTLKYKTIDGRELSLSEAVKVYSKETNESITTEIEWGEDTGLFIELDPGIMKQGEYSTTILWTLEDGP